MNSENYTKVAAAKSPGAEVVGSFRVEIGDQDQFSKFFFLLYIKVHKVMICKKGYFLIVCESLLSLKNKKLLSYFIEI